MSENHQVRDHCNYNGKYRGAAYDICYLRHKTPKEIPVMFHNGSTHDYHFIIKKLNDRFRFMPSSLSNLIDNLSDGFHCDKCIDCKSYFDYMITQDD